MPGMLRDNWKAVLLITLAVAVSYGATVEYGFVMDDFSLVVLNPNIKSPSNLLHLLTSSYWDAEGYSRGLYRPLNQVSWLLEYAAFGARPFIYHLDNLLLHALCSVLVFFLLTELLPTGRGPLYGALLFAVHPVHTEAVTWISCRGELMGAAFVLMSVITFIRSRKAGRPAYLSWAFFTLGLFSKESAAVAPALAAVYMLVYEDAGGRAARARAVVLAMIPYTVIFAAFLGVRIAVLGFLSPSGIDQAFHGMPASDRFLTMSRAVYDYVRLSLLPFDLRGDYFFPPPGAVWGVAALLSIVALVILAVSSRHGMRTHGWAYFAGLWFVVSLLPVLNIIPAHIIMSERVLYVPSAGVCMVMGMAFQSAGAPGRARQAVLAVFVAVLVMFMALTIERNRAWRDQDRFVETYLEMLDEGIKEHPEYAKLYKMRARIQTRFRPFGPDMERAVFEAARVAGPGDFEVHAMLSWVYYCKGMDGEALAEINETLKTFPSGHYQDFAASILLRLGRYGEALDMVDKAVAQNPLKSEYYINRGNILYEMGRKEDALGQFLEASSLDPDNHAAYVAQGVVFEELGKLDRAVAAMERALMLRPDLPEVHYNAALTFEKAGDLGRAERELRAALAIDPGHRAAAAELERLGR